ncbi:MAG TPA: translation initiation factor IF-2 N-terminal domain-containing protein, partial [Gaiellaceae bacterium]|nr:translation initiation factor IF-2 N-terminal domain-containing protein [Gaiellaceae bacterium]
MSKRIHELAKEWAVQPKDVLAAAEQLGMKGKRSQSTMTDDEVVRLRQALGLSPRSAQPTLGAERVIAERMVTQREHGVDRLVTAREQTTETRLQANVIRRRTAREVVKREELP